MSSLSDKVADLLDDEASKRRDLDETRRLLYMALVAHRTKKHEIVGTVVNALVHHQSAVDADEAIDNVVSAVDGEASGLEWVRARIAAISDAG